MSINEESREWADGAQRNSLQPHYESKSQPPYELYGRGITEANRGLIEAIIASIRNARGRILVAVVVVLALCIIACEMLEKSVIGALIIALMILIIGFISLRRAEDKDAGQKENREKSKTKPAESGAGGNSQGPNRGTSTRNGGPDTNGGGE
jgi:hypothetical protein